MNVNTDAVFPECISFGAQADPMWSTVIVETVSGRETAIQNWSDARHRYDVSLAVRTASDYATVRAHFHTVRGRANGFLFRDPVDYTVASAAGKLLSSAGAAVTADGTYQLYKRYGSGSDAYDRKITRPDTPIQVLRTRSGSTTDIVGAGAAVTYTTGAVVISGHVSGDTYAWAGNFKVPCRYDTDSLPSVIVNKEPGMAGELLVRVDRIPVMEIRE